MFPSPSQLPASTAPRGFTLVELLGVLAIIAVLLTLTVPALQDQRKARQLTSTGDRLSAMVERARQNAISRNSLTLLLLPLDGPAARRSAVLMERRPRMDSSLPTSSDWKVISAWSTFPEGVAIDSTVATRLATETAALTPALPTVQQGGTAITNYHLLGFMPDGSILPLGSVTQPKLRLVEATMQGGSLVYTRDGGASNLYDMIFLPASGRIKVERH